jgi:polyvinyl alcohol dehydrogenase (cytochrome)
MGPDFDIGNSPILQKLVDGRSVIVVAQKSGVVWALDPDHEGAVLWQHRIGKGSALGGMEWGSAADGQAGYFPVSDGLMGPVAAGGLFALKLSTGEEIWQTHPPARDCPAASPRCVQAQSAAISVIPGVVFSGTTSGVMRAYSTTDGRILWEYDTVHEYTTVNGVPGKGGSINGPGPTIVGGKLFMNSGYVVLGGALPGNVLLAFGVER